MDENMSVESTTGYYLAVRDAGGARFRIVACVCAAMVALALIWVSFVSARPPWSTATALHIQAPATMPLHSSRVVSSAPGLRASQAARGRRASLARGRAVTFRRNNPVPQATGQPAGPPRRP